MACQVYDCPARLCHRLYKLQPEHSSLNFFWFLYRAPYIFQIFGPETLLKP